MNITLDAADFANLADFWKRAPEIMRKRLTQAMIVADAHLQSKLKQDLPRGAGGAAGLAGSIATDEHAFADNVIGMVFTNEPYAVYVEMGTKPHKMPIQPLLDWIKVKIGLLDDEARSAAFAIRGAIAKRGTKAQPVWQTTWDASQGFVGDVFGSAVVQIAADLAGDAA